MISHQIGDTGPAGGIVFYDKGDDTDGWRYLEAAPEDTEFDAEWGADDYEVYTQTGVGTGKENTQIIVYFLGNDETGRAAQICDSLSFNGFTDWFLPSKDELNLMYTNLKVNGLGGFSNRQYWSSSSFDSLNVWSQRFSSGFQFGDNNDSRKYNSYAVRAVRAF